MIGRRITTSLALLSALVFCAFAAQSASAAKAVNTTAVTCVSGGGNLDFSDGHCDTKVAEGTGKFGHTAIATGTSTTVTIDNSTTGGATSAAVLKGKAFGAAAEITCTKVHGVGWLENWSSGSSHHVEGTVAAEYTGCTVSKPAKCAVSEPIELKAKFEGVEGIGPGLNEMGVEFRPDLGENFVQITFQNKGAEACALNGKSLPVGGTAVATGAPAPTGKHSGSTPIFTNAMTKETLTFGGVAAEFANTGTLKMQFFGNPISFTTAT